jgi:UDP-N-acetylglucosamine 2-epimerase (non-hydrolysing)
MHDPFPEEIARRQLGGLATWHFAPTDAAVRNLLAEGTPSRSIHHVGNTVIDAMRIVRSGMPTAPMDNARTVLVTAHRRENWGAPLIRICVAIRRLAERNPDWRFVFSVHPNPALQAVVARELGMCAAVERLDSPPYNEWVEQLVRCDLILTDSGGIQEEACALGRPTLVLRETTERPEAVEAGTALIVGTQAADIIEHAERILGNAGIYARMAQPSAVFGDGHASERIVDILSNAACSSPLAAFASIRS